MKKSTERLITFLKALDSTEQDLNNTITYNPINDCCYLTCPRGVLATMTADNVVRSYELEDAMWSVNPVLNEIFEYKEVA